MKYFLDTNSCIYFLKGKNEKLQQKIISQNPNDLKIPFIVKAELLYGVEKSQRRDDNLDNINRFLFPLEIVGFNDKECFEYSVIRAELERKGKIIGPNDLLIAAIVKSNDGILVTNNIKEFKRVSGLRIEDWSSL